MKTPELATPARRRRWKLPSPSWLARTARIWVLAALIALASAALFLTQILEVEPLGGRIDLPWWALAGMFALAEVFVIHLQFRRDAHSFSLNEIPMVLGLYFASPVALVVGQLVGAALALALHRRQSPLKLFFNLSHLSLGAILSVLIFHSLVDTSTAIGPVGWTVASFCTLLAMVVGAVSIALAISLSDRERPRIFGPTFKLLVAVTLTNTSLGLAAATVLWIEPMAIWLLIVPTALMFIAYRAYTTQREKNASLEFLYESTRMLNQSLQVGSALEALLSQARKMFRAELASVTLFPAEDDEPAMRTTLGPGDHFVFMAPVSLDPTEGVWARVASERESILLARPIRNERLHHYFKVRNIRDAMVAPLFGENAEVIGTMLIGNRLGDVSTFDSEDLKLFETLGNHASVSLANARLVGRLEESLAHLTEMNRLKDDFVASVSHELRTPLTSILGYVKTLRRSIRRIDPVEQDDFLETIERQGDRLRHLIEDLLVVSKLEAAQVVPAVGTISLPHVARQIVEECRERSEHNVELDFEEGMPLVRTDEAKVYQILINLVDNSIKYSQPGTRIVVAGRRQSDGVRISVIDQGVGIPDDEQEKIFDRFYQVDQSSTRSVGGTGLGLYICRRLADVIGGRLWLERSSGTGSVFCLWIPSIPPVDRRPRDSRDVLRAVPSDKDATATDKTGTSKAGGTQAG
ncbi:MAG: ATP-binding protein [Actinomycetota bacterium]